MGHPRARRLTAVAFSSMLLWVSTPARSTSGDDPPAAPGSFPRSPEQSAAAIVVGPGIEARLFAADPHLASPVAMAFDADGDVYVAEMLDYPIVRTPGMFGPFPEGQVRKLRTDGRGRVVDSTVFATALGAPTSVLPYDGGVLVAAAPDIVFLKDTDGDGHADIRKVVLTGFDASQDLYRLNSLIWGVDGWIYARGVGDTPIQWGDDPAGPPLSTGAMSFRFRPWERKLEPVSGLSSCFGLTTDDWGHLLFSNSANHVYQVVLPDRYVRRNPYMVAPPLYREISDHGGVAKIHRVSEPQPWRVERSAMWRDSGLTKKYFGDIEPRQDYMTAVCGPLVYRGSAFPAEYRGNYFVCEAVSNLVHRDVLHGPGPVLTASRAEPGREFLASKDNWCSPVYLDAGPDGAIYVVDMYRQIIEHAGADGGRDVPNVPLEILNKYGLRAGSTMGRIYRVAPVGTPEGPKPDLARSQPAALAQALGSADAWWRSTAQRLTLERPADADAPAIAAVVARSPHPAARVQALWTLDALGKLDAPLIAAALRDPSPGVRENALRVAEARLADSPELVAATLKLGADPDPAVRYQLAFTLGEMPASSRDPALSVLADLVIRGADDPYLRAAVLSSAGDRPLELYRAVALRGDAGPTAFLREAAEVIGSRLDRPEIAGLLEAVASSPPGGRAETLRGLAAGIRRRGRPDIDLPAAGIPLAKLRADGSAEVREAAEAVSALVHARTPEERSELIRRGIEVALDDSAPEADRARAADSLAFDSPEVAPALARLLAPERPEPLRRAALRALDGQSGPEAVRLVAEAWPTLTAGLREEAGEMLMGRKDRLGPLLDALGSGRIPAADLLPSTRTRLLGSTDKAVADAARALLGAPPSPTDPARFERAKPALNLAGDATRGRSTFKKLCIGCHKLEGEGAEVGPDLASVKNRPGEQVLKDILYPSMSFAPQYRQYVLATTDGRLITGLMSSSSASGYTIRRQGGEETTLLRKDVEELSATGISLMPENLLDGLEHQDVADLLRFVTQPR